jgi:hypothetical protein
MTGKMRRNHQGILFLKNKGTGYIMPLHANGACVRDFEVLRKAQNHPIFIAVPLHSPVFNFRWLRELKNSEDGRTTKAPGKITFIERP